MRRHATSGMSLLEVIIASALMVTAVAAIFEALTATKHLSSNAEAKDELAAEADVILSSIASDLTLSGWHLPTSEDFDRSTTLDAGEDLNGNGVIDSITYANQTKAQDRDAWYFPYVQIQGLASSQGQRFAHALRTPALYTMPPLPEVLPGNPTDLDLFNTDEEGWRNTFSGHSQELIFLKATVGHWDAAADTYSFRKSTASYAAVATEAASRQTLDFSGTRAQWRTAGNHDALGILHPSGWAPVTDASGNVTSYAERAPALPYGVVLDAGWYDPLAEATDDDATIKVQWETLDTPTFRLTDYAPARLREYMYAVVPSPLGFGRLVRAVKVSASEAASAAAGVEIGNILTPASTSPYRMQIDRVLSDNVTRVVFDTYRTVDDGASEVTTLAANQIRVRLYLARRQLTNPDLIVSRVFESVLGMRARSSSSEVNATTTILGTQPIGLVR